MREAASCGFWVASRTPIATKSAPPWNSMRFTAPVVRRVFKLADEGRWMLDIPRVLNEESIASAAQQCA